MRISKQSRLQVEMLERRDCPSVSATVVGGNLVVVANTATSVVSVKQTGASSYQIKDNGAVVANRNNVTGGLRVYTGQAVAYPRPLTPTKVNIDFGGFQTKNVQVLLGNGANTVSIVNGTINGSLLVRGGTRADTVTLGDDVNALTVDGPTDLRLQAGNDTFTARANVQLASFTSTLGETVSFDVGSVVTDSVHVSASSTGSAFNLRGDVGGAVTFVGSSKLDRVLATGSIGSLSLKLSGGNDFVDLSQSTIEELAVDSEGFGGSKTLLIGDVNDNAVVNLGTGSDTVILRGNIGNTLLLTTNAGTDRVVFDDGSSVALAIVDLGAGADVFDLKATASVTGTGIFDGGADGDTLFGFANFTPNETVIFETLIA